MKEKLIHKFTLPLWGSLLLAVLLAGCITLLALWCQPNALRTVLVIFQIPASADRAERPAGGAFAADLCVSIQKCLLRRSTGELFSSAPSPFSTGSKSRCRMSRCSRGLCAGAGSGQRHADLRHPLPGDGHCPCGPDHGAAGGAGGVCYQSSGVVCRAESKGKKRTP